MATDNVIELNTVQRAMDELLQDCHETFDAFRAMVEACCPMSREKSLCLTKIDEAEMWFDKAFPNSLEEE